MMRVIKGLLRAVLPARLVYALRVLYRGIPEKTSGCALFDYDKKRFYEHSACAGGSQTYEGMRARIIMGYHIVEKGLTMANRRMGFGKNAIMRLMDDVTEFESKFGKSDSQVNHAVGVIKEYLNLHSDFKKLPEEAATAEFWNKIGFFVEAHPSILASRQLHFSRDDFFAHNEDPFPIFASARHTVRNYSSEPIAESVIVDAVRLAGTAPSACNRQHCRVHYLNDKDVMRRVLNLQNGNRGFGHLASCLLIVTADIEDTVWNGERSDVYINGGIFLMNLCYALHYNKVGSCILNWSCLPETDIAVRRIVSLKPSETIIALLSCGYVPAEFDVCESPRDDFRSLAHC